MAERKAVTRREQIERYIERVNTEDNAPCKYGHFGCATHEGGPCSDELAGQLPPEEDEDG
jgi:hypothetical protein